MTKKGKQWLEALEGKELRYDPTETARIAEALKVSSYEEKAQEIARELIEDKIPDGIASCISRDSDRLGLPVPFKFLASQAFQELKLWAEQQGLVLMVRKNTGLPSESDEISVLSIYPDRGKNMAGDTTRAKAS